MQAVQQQHQHKRRSPSPEQAGGSRSSSPGGGEPQQPQSSQESPAAQELTIPFAFSSESVSPLSADQSARGRIRRKLSEEGDSVDCWPAPKTHRQPVHKKQLHLHIPAATQSTSSSSSSSPASPGSSSHPHQSRTAAPARRGGATVGDANAGPPAHSPAETTAGPFSASVLSTTTTSTRPSVNVLGLNKLTPPTATFKSSSMSMRRRASLPKLNLAVANRLPGPRQGVVGSIPTGATTATCATSRLLDTFSATTHPTAQEEYPYANGPIEVVPGVYLGAEHNTKDGTLLRKLNIGAVLNVAKEVRCPYTSSDPSPSSSAQPQDSHSDPSNPDASHLSAAAATEPPRIRIAASTPDLRAQYSNALNSLAHAQQADFPATDRFPALSYFHVPLSHDVCNLAAALPALLAFIALHLDRGVKVLVHCQCGVSRSASVLVAWVMQAQHMTMHAAYDQVKDKSSYISPNISLLYQLMDFEKAQSSSSHSHSSSSSQSPSNTTSGSSLGSEEGDDDDLVKTPPDDHFDQAHAIVDGLLSPALADRLAFTPPEKGSDLPMPSAPLASPDGIAFVVQQPSPSSQQPSPARRPHLSSPPGPTHNDHRAFRSNSSPQMAPSGLGPSPPMASPLKSRFNFDLGGLSTVPESSNPFTSSSPSTGRSAAETASWA